MSKHERINELETLIQEYQSSYYNGEAEISDSAFDLLWDELKILSPGSEVLKKIGDGDDSGGFPKAKHIIPMGSQDKASSPQEFATWAQKLKLNSGGQNKKVKNKPLSDTDNDPAGIILVQYKLDGASLELQYDRGILARAVTRGDGITGDDITNNARRMKGVVQKLDIPFSGGIRGEVIMTHDIRKDKYPSKANCRNAANGIMRRKDGEGCGDLNLVVYDASSADDDHFFENELQKLKWLEHRGFQTAETKTFTDIQEIIAYRDEVAAGREELPFDIDGLVVKNNETDIADLRKARPEKQIAFKFELETAFSILRKIEWSESGATYTPIGIIDPVRLAGTTVKRANLNNPGMIRAMELRIGSAVSVVKRGEIIPKIEGLAPCQGACDETREIIIPEVCSVCGTALVDAGTRLYCPAPQCPKRLLHRLEKWVQVLDIRELGEKLIRQLFDRNIKYIHQLYSLKREELSLYDRMGDISAAKVIRSIQAKRIIGLAEFIAGFDFEGIAETIMEKITAAGFDTLERLRVASVSDLCGIRGLGEITASVVVQGLRECGEEMDAVLRTGFITIKEPVSGESLPLRGLSFCFTGELKSMKRSEAEGIIKALGGQSKTSVTKDLSCLVTNDPESASSKNVKARELGIRVMGEDEFLSMINPLSTKPPPLHQKELF
ncbi:MAG: NAD-dependent DNA ligase LigA [Treponema sp.]|nr:NAD-dependent DNA ligase LigA [Treponema sp.]